MQAFGNQKIILAVIACAVFMATLDTSIVNIALPSIAASFNTDMGSVSWVVMAYLLVLSGLMLGCGRLGDIKGFRRVFIAGFAVFTLGSLLCGLAASIGLLVVFRLVQGIGAAAIEAIAPAMITVCLPEEKRGWALGILMTVVSIAIAAGPVLGGYITEFLGWNWVFFVNVPIGILAIVLAACYLPQDVEEESPGQFDTFGSGLILIAFAALLFPLNQGLYIGWTSPVVLGSFLASLFFFFLFVYHEKHCKSPLIDMGLLSVPNYLRGNIAGMLIIFVFAGSEFLLPFFFENVRGISTEIVGLLLTVPATALIVSGPVAGGLSDRYGSRGLMIVAALFCSVTMGLFAFFDTGTDLPFIIIALALEGFAVGLFMPPNMRLIMSSGSRDVEGIASGMMMTLRNLGAVLGIALFGSIAMQGFTRTINVRIFSESDSIHLVPGFHMAFLAGILICIIVAVISLTVRDGDTIIPAK